MDKFVPKGEMRKIISKENIPVRITNNPESVMHDEKVTLGVGDMVKMGEIQDPVLKEEEKLRRHVLDLEQKLTNDALTRVKETRPDATLEYSDYPMTAAMMEVILKEQPERQEEIAEAKALFDAIQKKRYAFGSRDKNDLYVGREGTLVYSVDTGAQAAKELQRSVVFKEKKSAIGGSEADPSWTEKIAVLSERMSRAKRVVDIHQVEVLPEHQGKGIAKALLDVALWDIEHGDKNVEFSVARVASTNPDGPKMIAAFKKAGFDAFYAGQLQWDDPTDWTLVVRENPNFKK